MRRELVIGMVALCLSACATSFTGSPYVEGGRAGCERKCSGQGMDVAGMVYMGEYSSACVCQAPGQSAAAGGRLLATSAGAAGGVVGVMQQQRAQQQHHHH